MSPSRLTLSMLAALVLSAGAAHGQSSLAARIDAEIQRKLEGHPLAAPASDAEFVRRAYLDLTGIIPSAAEARAFFDDQAADKRARLIDQLLKSDRYARHTANQFDTLLMDRRPDRHVKRAEWMEYLRSSFAANKPYDELVRELLSADGADPKNRAPAAFYLNREGEPHQITKDISRLFLGMNLGCAQCHDHPLVDAYKQDHYYGIYAFLNRSYLFTDKKAKLTLLAEKADGDASFQSVFMAKVTKTSLPRLPQGKEITEPKFEKGKEYTAPLKKGERGIPKFSRRAQLAAAVTGPENPRFARATANQLWSFLFGRGIVYPVEYDHPANPPSHPELLDLLAKELAGRKYDLKSFLKDVMLSQAYQRSSVAPTGTEDIDPSKFAVAELRPLTPEQFGWSMLQATGQLDADRIALKAGATEKALDRRYSGQINQVVRLFGTLPGEPASSQDFEATLDQTLFLRNGDLMRNWLTPRAGNLTDRLSKLKDAAPLAEELYLSVLTRRPTAEEAKDVADYLARRSADRTVELQELVWALVTSTEFRFNH